MSIETILLLAIGLPFITAILIAATGASPNLRDGISVFAGSVVFYLVTRIYAVFTQTGEISVTLLEMIPGLSISFVIEPLGMVFGLIASFLWIITTIYAVGYMRGHHEQNQTRFYVCFAIAIGSALGIAFAGNMLTLFVFYEVLTISTFPLVTHSGTEAAKKSGRVYLGILLGTSVGLQLIAIIWTWSLTGTLDFNEGGIVRGYVEAPMVGILLALYIFGIGKAAVMPFHRWLPAAMVAPTPVSALLHAVAVVKAGVFTVLKVTVYIFGIDFLQETSGWQWLQYVAAATILFASFIAMTKDNLKARLAYSTISQLSYIVLAAMLVTTTSIVGGGMHIAMHAFGKITLFFCAGAIMVASHKTEISQMRGIGRVMPFTTFAFLIGSLSIIGLPPFGGLWSKWYIALGALEADQIIMVGVLMVSSLLNVAYLLPIPFRGFFADPKDNPPVASNHVHDPDHDHSHDHDAIVGIKEAPWPCLLAIAITSIGCIVLFFYPEPLATLLWSIF